MAKWSKENEILMARVILMDDPVHIIIRIRKKIATTLHKSWKLLHHVKRAKSKTAGKVKRGNKCDDSDLNFLNISIIKGE